jgi:hypothetical protein
LGTRLLNRRVSEVADRPNDFARKRLLVLGADSLLLAMTPLTEILKKLGGVAF